MLSRIPDFHQAKLLLEYEALYASSNSEFLTHQEEVLSVWYASPFVKHVCLSQPEWLFGLFSKNVLHQNLGLVEYHDELAAEFAMAKDVQELQCLLRRARVTAFARIAWRDLQGYASVEQTLSELSFFAEVCLQETLNWCFQWIQSHSNADEFERSLENKIIVFALGKLGGGELNFSSDVDLVFAYSCEEEYNQTEQSKLIELYLKVVQLFIKVLAEQTQDGFVFRVDTRLRPFGESGPLLPSLSAIDQYFQLHGRDWERYAWIKARAVAGDIQKGHEFLQDVTSFVFRRYLDYGAMQSLREMKSLINKKAASKSNKEDLKIGYGGIREIEFIVQMFQLIYGGKNSSLRIHSTREALIMLRKQELISAAWAESLLSAYLFLRKAENVLQLHNDQQVHALPTTPEQKECFAYAMGRHDWQTFYDEYMQWAGHVHEIYQSLLKPEKEDECADELVDVWSQMDDREFCIPILNKHFSSSAEHVFKCLSSFKKSDLVKKSVPVAQNRLNRFIPILLHALSDVEDIPIIIDRFLGILEKIVQRSTYIALLVENKNKLSTIFKLIERSPWISRYLAIHPVLLDDVLSISKDHILPDKAEMQKQLYTYDGRRNELEEFMSHLREFKHSQVIQIAAADIIQDYPIMKVSDHLSWLAEICVMCALEYAYDELIEKYGKPNCVHNGKAYTPKVLIIEYGKLGGLELGYGSDLDMVFLHNSYGEICETTGENKIHNNVFFTRLVQRTIHILGAFTPAGKVFDVDLRLRPHGNSGPTITSLRAYENYLLNDAWLWEHQALVRARVITSSTELASNFISIRQKILGLEREMQDICISVVEMREKMHNARKSHNQSIFDIKQSRGGMIDIEFIVQFLVLIHASRHPELSEYTDNIRILDACAEVEVLDRSVVEELKKIYLKYRKHLHHLSIQLLPNTVTSDVFLKERDRVQKIWASLLHSRIA